MNRRLWTFVLSGLALSLALALFLSPFASARPDGLDRFAEDQHIEETQPVWGHAPMGEYKVAPVAHEGCSTGLAGLIGTVVVFSVAFGLGAVLRRRRGERDQAAEA